jgi:ribosomal protein L37AE/L43A
MNKENTEEHAQQMEIEKLDEQRCENAQLMEEQKRIDAEGTKSEMVECEGCNKQKELDGFEEFWVCKDCAERAKKLFEIDEKQIKREFTEEEIELIKNGLSAYISEFETFKYNEQIEKSRELLKELEKEEV